MNIIILGPQGSGKGTQAEMVARDFSLEHIDMGNTLRSVAKQDTPLGREVFQIQNVTKTLVPSRILKEVMHIKLGSLPREQGIVFDGVPRTLDQAKYVEEALLEFGRKVDKVFFINISEAESIRRISKRWMCGNCRLVFVMGEGIKNENDPCPKCGGRIQQRIDDTEEGVKKRLKVFREETVPVLEYFKSQGKLIEISGEQSVAEVYRLVKAEIQKLKG